MIPVNVSLICHWFSQYSMAQLGEFSNKSLAHFSSFTAKFWRVNYYIRSRFFPVFGTFYRLIYEIGSNFSSDKGTTWRVIQQIFSTLSMVYIKFWRLNHNIQSAFFLSLQSTHSHFLAAPHVLWLFFCLGIRGCG